MLRKQPKTSPWRRLKALGVALVVGESVFFIASYYYFRQLKRDQDYRHKMHKEGSWLLEMFYKTTELNPMEKSSIRESDYAAWGVNKS